ncbi:aldehyde dehydrogenase family protein [Microbacterium betulae]|uniref:aldehyde dehydrogenase (NAD(+)) n=1 Tax=Microbacterium betulae TaxID=2981139 RepID=A0AA97FHV7_9MICO|nr:aldehyde dehydrogenase family protein [Microbacterium sp. AB]WOF22864.1 aldehyde dehydrogenase family protein [Microbacterium sp. AB]
MIERKAFYIGGEWTAPAAGGVTEVRDPATGELVGRTPRGTAEDVDAAVAAARAAFEPWAATPPTERIAVLDRVRDALRARNDELADLISAEMGAPRTFSRGAHVTMAVNNFDAAARAMEEILAEGEETIGSTLVVREPVGVVGAITPWNFPLHQISAKVAPALAAGCTVVLKPSEVAPLSAYALAEIFAEAGLPAGVFNLVGGAGRVVGERIVAHPDVDMVSFTGSTQAGRRIAELAATGLKKVTLELGGKSANILLDDADLAVAVPAAVKQCYANTGQACAALSRLLVPRSLLDEVERRAAEAATAWTVGQPSDPSAKLGPVASPDQQRSVLGFIDSGIAEGARLVLGGPTPPIATGAFVSPTIFSDVTGDMTIAQEEIFGPVLSILPYDTEDEAVRIANSVPYGLSGGVWSTDRDRAVALARRLRTGQVVLNGQPLNLRAPFGGYGQSGLGREYGRYGLEEYFEIKSLQGAG